MEQQSAGLGFDVIEGEADQLGATQGRGVAEQNDRGVTRAERGAPVDGAQDLAEVGRGEGSGLTDRGDAAGAPQAAADLADRMVVGGVGNAADAVHVPDRGASAGEGLHGGAGLSAFGEVGAQRHRVGGEGVEGAGMAPALTLAPQVGVELRVEAARAAVTAAPMRCRSVADRPSCGWSQEGVASRFMTDLVADRLRVGASEPVPLRCLRHRQQRRTGTKNLTFR